jgi:hypothetical protein
MSLYKNFWQKMAGKMLPKFYSILGEGLKKNARRPMPEW